MWLVSFLDNETKCIEIEKHVHFIRSHVKSYSQPSICGHLATDNMSRAGYFECLVRLKADFRTKHQASRHSASQQLGTVRKPYWIFGDRSISVSCFRCFISPLLEYLFQCESEATWDLCHSRNVSSVCMMYKIIANQFHLLNASIPNTCIATRGSMIASNSPCTLLAEDKVSHW